MIESLNGSRPAMPARELGDFWTVWTKHRVAARLARRGACVLALAAAPLFAQSGDAAKGKTLVESNGCTGCHRIGDKGSRTGPDLSEIGDKRKAEQIKTSITDPDAEVLPENRYVEVTLKDGSTVKGRILNHDAMSVQLIDTKQDLRSFLTANIRGYTILTKGLMPKPNLTEEQVSDIVAYLSSLKGTEAP
jgi:putative heme-binding domain-containing protein